MSIMSHVPEQVKLSVDGLAIAAWASALTGALTSAIGLLAAIASLVWGCIRIYETHTFQAWLEKMRERDK